MASVCATCNARNSSFCSVFDGEEIVVLYAKAHALKVEVGGYLLHEDDSSHYVYNVSSGTLALERLASNGAKQIMAFLYTGNFIGISSGTSYSVSGRALTPLTACKWDLRDLESLYQDFPRLEERVHEIAQRIVEATMDQLFVLGRKSTVEKIAWFLLFIEAKQSLVEDVSESFYMPMTRVDIADYLGLAVETVSRGFSSLRRKGVIEISKKWNVKIINRTGLKRKGEYCGPPPENKKNY